MKFISTLNIPFHSNINNFDDAFFFLASRHCDAVCQWSFYFSSETNMKKLITLFYIGLRKQTDARGCSAMFVYVKYFGQSSNTCGTMTPHSYASLRLAFTNGFLPNYLVKFSVYSGISRNRAERVSRFVKINPTRLLANT